MVSLWGSKKDDDPEPGVSHDGESSERIAQPRHSEADERTRLLPPPRHEGYLSPDDPAVSFHTLELSHCRCCRGYLGLKLIKFSGISL